VIENVELHPSDSEQLAGRTDENIPFDRASQLPVVLVDRPDDRAPAAGVGDNGAGASSMLVFRRVCERRLPGLSAVEHAND
jgi:hypothetical protein